MRGPIISTEKSTQTLARGLAPPHRTTPGVFRMTYPSYGSSDSTQT